MKKVIYKIIYSILISLFLSGCFVDVIEDQEVYTSPLNEISTITNKINLNNYPKVKEYSDFPIIAWYSIPDSALYYERFLEAKEAGINLSLFEYSNVENVQIALNLAQKVGIKVLIACPELYTNTDYVVNRFKKHPANGGYFLQDEPTLFYLTQLVELSNKIESVDDTRFTYINLLPNYSTTHYTTDENYYNYVQSFVNEIPLKVLSFDHYPIIQNMIRPIWYHNLEIIKSITDTTNIPFWSFALSSAHSTYSIPTIEHLRLQVYSNIAYGAKGIQYFTYWIPNNTIYNSAPIDRNGNKTKEYFILKEMNNEIKNLSYIFQTSKVKKVSHYGHIPFGTDSLSNLPFYVKSIEIKGGNALIAEMENIENLYFMIQNTNLFREIEIDIETDSESKILLKNGYIIPSYLIKEKFKLTPGDIVIFAR